MVRASSRWFCACLVPVLVWGCGGGGRGGTSGPAPLTFAANSIVYGAATGSGQTYTVTEMSPTGTRPVTVASGVPNTIQLFAINPAVPSQLALAADPTGAGSYGIYLSGTLGLSNATALVTPAYTAVNSITVTENGRYVVYSAVDSVSGVSNLYAVPVAGGTPVEYGLSDGSAVSPADNDTIAYVAPVGTSGNDQVYTRSLAAGTGGSTTQLTSDSSNHLLPAFSPNGALLAFWEETGSSDTLVVDTLASSTLLPLSNPSGILAQGEAFSNDSSTLVIAGELNGSGNIFTQPANGSAAPASILSASSLLGNYGVFWTDVNGRVAGSIGGMSSAARRHVLR